MIAKCYIKKEDDDANMLYFDTRMLVMRFGGVSHRFSLSSKIALAITHKKLIVPILFGGLVGCFTLISIWQNLFLPILILLLFLAAMGAFYYGWMGNFFLEITQFKTTINFPITKNSQNLQQFIDFFHHYQSDMQLKPLYHVATKSQWEMQQHNSFYTHPSLETDGFIHAATDKQLSYILSHFFSPQQEVVILEIDTLRLGSPIKYEGKTEAHIYPHIYGKISYDAIRKSYPILAEAYTDDLLSH